MKYKLLITEPAGFSQEAKDILGQFCDVVAEPSKYEDLKEKILHYDILFIRLGIKFDREIFRRSKQLRYIVTPTTGLDHIDLNAADEHGVEILSLANEKVFLREISATAELAWGLLLSLVRNIPWAFDDVKNGGWNRDTFKGCEISGKRLGILGLGRLGEKVAEYGIAFGMRVIAFDPYRTKWKKGIARAASLNQLLMGTDILSIHVPLNPETEKLLGEAELGLLPEKAWIINTSRGRIIDEDALVNHLQTGHLSGAALDVLADESTNIGPGRSKLVEYARQNRNLVITPHIGGATAESMQKTEIYMAYKLLERIRSTGKIN